MQKELLPRLDLESSDIREKLLPFCRLNPGEIWDDPMNGHKVACGDATDISFLNKIFGKKRASLAIFDPPYNLVMFEERSVGEFIEWCKLWINNSWKILDKDSALYIWLGADQNDHYQPLPQFMCMMAETDFKSRSFITMRNQRGYGTQKNWMAVRQELLYYTKGKPDFEVHYTDIPKILRGYYKNVGGKRTENIERSLSENIRPGNVWVDLQQVFYRMHENVSGCYAQKPIKAIERIINSSSDKGDIVTDFFAGSGTTLISCEKTGRACYTVDIDPIFAEINIRRLEHFRKTGHAGWQASNPFVRELNQTEIKIIKKAPVVQLKQGSATK